MARGARGRRPPREATRLDWTRSGSRVQSTIKAGFGSCASSSRSSDSRSGCITSPSSGSSRSGSAAKPPASSSRLRSAIGRSRCWARSDAELATRAGPAGLDEAQMLVDRDVRSQRQLQLAQATVASARSGSARPRVLGLLLGVETARPEPNLTPDRRLAAACDSGPFSRTLSDRAADRTDHRVQRLRSRACRVAGASPYGVGQMRAEGGRP